MKAAKSSAGSLVGDLLGGTAGMLVALPSTIAYGLMCFAPLGPKYSSIGAIGAILGTIPLCFLAPFLGGMKILISAPTAATAAVISTFTAELVRSGTVPVEIIPMYVTLVGLLAGLIQLVIGNFGGGKFIKYIPYPVITGYLSGLSVLVLIGQLPKLMGLPKGTNLTDSFRMFGQWKWDSICIGVVTIVFMAVARKYIKKVPAVIVGLLAGVAAYWVVAAMNPALRTLNNNPYVLGEISTSVANIVSNVTDRVSLFSHFSLDALKLAFVPAMTIMLLLSINTLNTCIILDASTYSHHDPRKELMIQGTGNVLSALSCGIPGAGILTSSIENLRGGGTTSKSVLIVGINSLLVLLLCGKFVAWIPLPALAGILIMVAISLIDFTIFTLLKNKSTVFDFVVIIAVIIAAAKLDLIRAAGVGTAMAILLFLKEQMSASVIRRKLFGDQVSSKKVRLSHERDILVNKGKETIIIQLHGQLFFGTTDQLYSKLQPYFSTCKYFVLDMHRIQSVDYTAANMLKKILVRVAEQDGYLIFSSIPETLATGQNPKKYLKEIGLLQNPNVLAFDDMDETLTWVEDKVLIDEEVANHKNTQVLSVRQLEFFDGFSDKVLEAISGCIETQVYKDGEYIFKVQEDTDTVYFVAKGHVKLVLPLKDGKQYHLQTICMGGIFGEMAFIHPRPRSANALTLDEVHLYSLSRQKFNEISSKYPEVAAIFFERMALIIANRLRYTNEELKIFQEN